jgi:asparagine synthase (glutamine-hydrolysing)
MCGIAGIVTSEAASIDVNRLTSMTMMLNHRGPDDRGVHVEPGLGFGHARLSIVDLAGGRQPMSNADGSLWITFNGEIFNYVELREELVKKGHRFRTESDTEVLLHLYEEDGTAAVERLNGQWAFAIWNRRSQTLFLSRDPLGVRPLFYTTAGRRLLFASEIKALFVDPEVSRELDPRGVDNIFTFWTTLAPRTGVQGDSRAAARPLAGMAQRQRHHIAALESVVSPRPMLSARWHNRRKRCDRCSMMRSGSECAPTCRSGRT